MNMTEPLWIKYVTLKLNLKAWKLSFKSHLKALRQPRHMFWLAFHNFCYCIAIYISLPSKVFHDGNLEENFTNFVMRRFTCMFECAGVSENEKTTTACNFQTMAMNSLVIPHVLMRDQIGGYSYMQTYIYITDEEKYNLFSTQSFMLPIFS